MTGKEAERYDAIVLGCGPVGGAAANLLGRLGLSVAVVERAAEPYPKPRAITADHEMLRALQHAGIGPALDAMIAPHPGTTFLGVDGAPIKHLDPMPPPYPLAWLPTATFMQPELENALRAGLAALPTVATWFGCEASLPEQDADGVYLDITPQGGLPRPLRASFLLACDGAASPVRKRLGITMEDLQFDEWWLVVDTWERKPVELPAKFIQYCWPERPATFIRGPRDIRRWEIKLLPGEDPQAFGAPENIRQQIARFADPDALEVWRSAVYRFHALVATTWRARRIFLLGDAAHQTPPFMGQGLCSGIRDAFNLVWKLAAVLHGTASAGLLDTYEAERRPHFRAVVARTKEIGEIIGELDPEAARRRDATLRAELASGRAEIIRQRLIPDLQEGLIAMDAAGRPASGAGTLFVQPYIMNGLETLRLDDAVAPGFMLAVNAAGQGWADDATLARCRELGVTCLAISPAETPPAAGVLHFTETGTVIHDWMADFGAGAALVRPDRVVFGVARTATELAALLADLTARYAPPPHR